ncbi:MAG: aldo/keto reductase [Bryobacterales bacterium]|nr:aldo/keto reductase [Acidobacteriota bacterium]MCB9383691.1 aldo/keto reductase [Bryobacterales bacterium]
MNDSISRRTFLGGAVASSIAVAGAKTAKLPTRTLGRTGATPSIMALGCGSRLLSYGDQEKGSETVRMAIDSGITYIDTAQDYGNGRSETWVGEVMKSKRNEVWLATKTGARTYDDVLKRIEESLKRLNTDHVDLLHLHSLQHDDDLATIEKERVMEAMYRVRDEKMARFIGITSHTNPSTLKSAIERYDIDCTQMALNAALQGMQNGKGKMILNPAMTTSFEEVALPAARKKNLGVIAMKVFGQEDIVPDPNDKAAVNRLIQYSLSLDGVAVAVMGCPKHEFLHENVASVRAYKPMSKSEMKKFSGVMSEKYKQALDLKFQRHLDA